MHSFADIVSVVSSFIWGWPMIILLLGTHLFLTIRLRFPQSKIFKAIGLSFKKDKGSSGDVSQFGALATSLAATIGTGNIIGVATAVSLGGPGAVLWCWLTGIFGIATKYGEGLLSIKYRVKTEEGTMLGGPMYALERGLHAKWLAVIFCVSLVTLVVCFGIKGIARVCEVLVPFMAIFCIFGCVAILALNWGVLGQTISLICHSAFSAKAGIGGLAGTTVMMACRFGIARGLFSNESGMGSAPIAAAAAKTRNPVRQALVSSTGTFWDTVVVCALTGLVLVSSIINNPSISYTDGAKLTQLAFGQIPKVGSIFLTISLVTFTFSTILGWSYYAEKAIEYLAGHRFIIYYRVIWVALVYVGAVLDLSLVWNIADIMNAMMAVPNIIALLLLSGVIVAETRKYLWSGNLDKASDEDIPTITDRRSRHADPTQYGK